jgi:hypothetical protein
MLKIHERIAERTQPSAKSTTTPRIIDGDASKVGRKTEAAWINSQEAAAYAAATL